MITDRDVHAFTRMVSAKFDPQEAYAILTRFSCRCLEPVQPLLPPIGQASLEIAKAYWLQGVGQEEDLEAARDKCWQYLDQKGRSAAIVDDEDVAMRAVLCVLYPLSDEDDYLSDSMEWFADLMNRLNAWPSDAQHYMIAP